MITSVEAIEESLNLLKGAEEMDVDPESPPDLMVVAVTVAAARAYATLALALQERERNVRQPPRVVIGKPDFSG